MKNRMLELREQKKSKKPVFIARDSQRRKEVVQNSWRKPRGKHSKTRLHHGGNPKMPSQGYRSPREVRGLHKSGLKTVVVRSIKQIGAITGEGIIIGSSVGLKKKLEIMKAAAARKLDVLNFDASAFIKKAEEMRAERKNKNAEAASAQKKPEKTGASTEKKASAETDEEKRKAEKKEMEKIITKRG